MFRAALLNRIDGVYMDHCYPFFLQTEEQTFAQVVRIHIQQFGRPMYYDILILKISYRRYDITIDFRLTVTRVICAHVGIAVILVFTTPVVPEKCILVAKCLASTTST